MLPKVVNGPLPPGLPHERVLAYHERTKHRADAYAAGPATVDWDAPPAPFRSFAGAPVTFLPLLRELPSDDVRRRAFEAPYAVLARTSGASAPWDRTTFGVFLESALGLTAWKSDGVDRWCVRAHPSSGNLHPVEAYLLAFGVHEVPDGLHHYGPRLHTLEQRRRLAPAQDGVWLALTSIMWREAWKYGERAFRYCQLDVGHVVEALRVAGEALGFRVAEVPIASVDLAAMLGLDGAAPSSEREEPELLLQLLRRDEAPRPPPLAPDELGGACLPGVPSVIDPYPLYEWPAVNEVAELTRSSPRASLPLAGRTIRSDPGAVTHPSPSYENVIWGRRSAQRFDRDVALSGERLALLLRVLASAPRALSVVLFPRRVEGLCPGVLTLSREGGEPELERRRELSPTEMAQSLVRLHCRQSIAAHAALVIGFWAALRPEALRDEPHLYRLLHRMAGASCHRVYLAAEALGLRATGLGCFLDDEVQRFGGVDAEGGPEDGADDGRLLPLYHVALGHPLPDPRFVSAPPYAERDAPTSARHHQDVLRPTGLHQPQHP